MITNRGIGGSVPRQARRPSAPPRTAFDPVIQSAADIVRESAGLLSNIAGLGLALFVDIGAAPPRPRPAPRAASIIPFPIARRSDRQR